MDPEQCSEMVSSRERWTQRFQCSRKGRYPSANGKMYCKQHLPENVKAKQDERTTMYDCFAYARHNASFIATYGRSGRTVDSGGESSTGAQASETGGNGMNYAQLMRASQQRLAALPQAVRRRLLEHLRWARKREAQR